jgi:hypothetical protein
VWGSSVRHDAWGLLLPAPPTVNQVNTVEVVEVSGDQDLTPEIVHDHVSAKRDSETDVIVDAAISIRSWIARLFMHIHIRRR